MGLRWVQADVSGFDERDFRMVARWDEVGPPTGFARATLVQPGLSTLMAGILAAAVLWFVGRSLPVTIIGAWVAMVALGGMVHRDARTFALWQQDGAPDVQREHDQRQSTPRRRRTDLAS